MDFNAKQFMRDFSSNIKSSYNGYERIDEPKIGSIVYQVDEKGIFTKVRIVSGRWWGDYGLSNFWYWKEITEDGESETKHGYGNFYINA